MKKLLLLLPLMFLFVGTMAQAQDPVILPTPPHIPPIYTYHYDPMFPVVDWHVAPNAGLAGKVTSSPFVDALAAPGDPWHWETEWYNSDLINPIDLPIIFRAQGLGARAGILHLAPGQRVIIEWMFNEAPELGSWRYTMTPMVGNPGFDHDASLCEGPAGAPVLPPEWEPRPEPEIKHMEHTEVVISHVIPTISTWGIIVLVLLLLTAATLIIRRRRVEA